MLKGCQVTELSVEELQKALPDTAIIADVGVSLEEGTPK